MVASSPVSDSNPTDGIDDVVTESMELNTSGVIVVKAACVVVCSFPTVVTSSPVVSVSNTVDGNEEVVAESSSIRFVDVLDDIVVVVSASVKSISGFVGGAIVDSSSCDVTFVSYPVSMFVLGGTPISMVVEMIGMSVEETISVVVSSGALLGSSGDD